MWSLWVLYMCVFVHGLRKHGMLCLCGACECRVSRLNVTVVIYYVHIAGYVYCIMLHVREKVSVIEVEC